MSLTPKDELKREQEKLAALLQDREQIEVAIAKAKRRVAAWAELCDDSKTGEQIVDLDLGGLTEACRTVLRSSGKGWITTAEIQADLKELGFPLDKYKAPAASITTTVNRLVEAGEVAVNRRSNPGATEYRWAPTGRDVYAPHLDAKALKEKLASLTERNKRK
jgi:DNA-binding HxlR family transcriptional regulator